MHSSIILLNLLFLFQGVTAEVFRLNESSLWYELLVHPEACCLKWANEADYVMPILTPNLLKEFHGTQGDEDNGTLVPTSPVINRYDQVLKKKYRSVMFSIDQGLTR